MIGRECTPRTMVKNPNGVRKPIEINRNEKISSMVCTIFHDISND
jgi:hypothetical protein